MPVNEPRLTAPWNPHGLKVESQTITLPRPAERLTVNRTTTDHLNLITASLKRLRAHGFESRQAVELLLNEQERNELKLLASLERTIFDAIEDGVGIDEIVELGDTIEEVVQQLTDSLVH